MQDYDFDHCPPRRGTNCVKWDDQPAVPDSVNGCPAAGAATDVIPLWVADMDFTVAPAIEEAVRRRAKHPVYGYATVGEAYYDAVIDWFRRRHQWSISREDMLYTTGVVPAMSCCLQALTMPGDQVLILTPVYNCFFSSIRNSGCVVSDCALTYNDSADGHPYYTVDWELFEQRCADDKCSVFLLCNPHNPAGRVWTADELRRMSDICRRHHVLIVSDEIHCELTLPGISYTPMMTIDAEAIALTSASKSFNIAGLQMACIVSSNADVRRRIDRAININEVCDVNPFAPLAQAAAYNDSEAWLDALREYIAENYRLLCRFFADTLPQLRVTRLEGTYLAWVDISALGLTSDEVALRLLTEGGVRVSPGSMYGDDRFIRINMACPRSQLQEGLRRIATLRS